MKKPSTLSALVLATACLGACSLLPDRYPVTVPSEAGFKQVNVDQVPWEKVGEPKFDHVQISFVTDEQLRHAGAELAARTDLPGIVVADPQTKQCHMYLARPAAESDLAIIGNGLVQCSIRNTLTAMPAGETYEQQEVAVAAVLDGASRNQALLKAGLE